MFGVRGFVDQNICLLYLSISSCSANFFFGGGNLEFLEGKLSPPDVPRINPGLIGHCYGYVCSVL